MRLPSIKSKREKKAPVRIMMKTHGPSQHAQKKTYSFSIHVACCEVASKGLVVKKISDLLL